MEVAIVKSTSSDELVGFIQSYLLTGWRMDGDIIGVALTADRVLYIQKMVRSTSYQGG